MTTFGAILRRLSLAALPEFSNVVSCDMSLVAPRPLRTEVLSRYSPETRRHDARRGITGWAHAPVGSYPVVETEAMRVAHVLRPFWPCSVQLRPTQRGPVTLDVNPRFPGAVGMQAQFGYNEVEMAIRAFVLHPPVARPHQATGTALEYWGEMSFDDAAPFPPEGPGDSSPAGPLAG